MSNWQLKMKASQSMRPQSLILNWLFSLLAFNFSPLLSPLPEFAPAPPDLLCLSLRESGLMRLAEPAPAAGVMRSQSFR